MLMFFLLTKVWSFYSIASQMSMLHLASASYFPSSQPKIIHTHDVPYIQKCKSYQSRHHRVTLLYDELKTSIFRVRGGGNSQKPSMPPLAFASSMSFLAGYSDVICFQKFQCYTSMMTGNLIMLSISLAEGNWIEAVRKSSLIISFFIGACISRSFELLCKDKQNSTMETRSKIHLKRIAPIVFVLFSMYDCVTTTQEWAKYTLALAYGMVYSAANQALGATITQLMTGHITKLGFAVSDRFIGRQKRWNPGSLMSLCIVSSFVVGAVAGLQPLLSSFGNGDSVFTIIGLLYATLLLIY